MSNNGTDGRIRLGALEFDPDVRMTIVQGRETLLDSRSSLVLKMLVERHGRRVSKDELLRGAWPRQTVHENSLAKAISRLRPAIRGSGLEIAAAYGTGYVLRPLPCGATDEPVEGPSVETKPLASNAFPADLSSRTLIALFAVHWARGFSVSQGGYEFVLLLGVVLFAIAIRGGGPYSADNAIGKEL